MSFGCSNAKQAEIHPSRQAFAKSASMCDRSLFHDGIKKPVQILKARDVASDPS